MRLACCQCGLTKPADDFYVSKTARTGRQSQCKVCQKANNAKRTYRPEVRAAWAQRNPEKVAANTKAQGVRKHGLTPEQFDAMFEAQGGACAACGATSQRRLCIDHDHNCCDSTFSCGKCVRGLLCTQCNTALGLLGDDRRRVTMLLSYIDSLNDMGLI